MVNNLGHTYHPSTLTKMKAKGNKWYVVRRQDFWNH